jgi:UPF0755 protein
LRRPARLALLVGLGTSLLAALVLITAAERRPHRGWEGETVVIEIPPGLTTRDIARELAEAGVIRFPSLFVLRARLTGRADRLHAGEYLFDAPVRPEEVLHTLAEGRVLLHPVTVPEGLTLEQTAARLAAEGVAAEEALIEAFRNPAIILDLDPRAPDLEGYLHPDTYSYPRGVSADEVAATMVGQLRRVLEELAWTGEGPQGLDLRQVLTLASLVEKETAVPEERALIAGVFAGRLERGWPLECDPTVRYALVRDGKLTRDRPLRRADLSYPSPYNTYRVGGLPPGPICSAGSGALAAALAPAETSALFFVARGDGTGRHEFSDTLREHLAAVSRYRERRRNR